MNSTVRASQLFSTTPPTTRLTKPFWRFRLRVVLCAVAALLALSAYAQDALSEMRALLDGGSYYYAAQVAGPALVAANPEAPETHFLYSRALYLTGDAEGAAAQLEAARRLSGSDTPAYLWLDGLLAAAAGDLEEGERRLERAFSEGRTGEAAYGTAYEMAMDWGRVAWQRGNAEGALSAFEAAAATERGQQEPWPELSRGRLLMYEGDFDGAVKAFERAITVFEENDTSAEGLPSPAYVEAYYRLGQVYELTGDADTAARHYEFARISDPNYAPALEALARLEEAQP